MTWCKSKIMPIDVGWYRMHNGSLVQVVRSERSGRYYARDARSGYQPGLIFKLRAELEHGIAYSMPLSQKEKPV